MINDLAPMKPPESELLIVTGMSGAGRTTAAHALEDMGWYVVEGSPELITTMMDLIARNPGSVEKLAVVLDVRSRRLYSNMRDSWRRSLPRGSATGCCFSTHPTSSSSAASNRVGGPTRSRAKVA
ncbi:hypothetical protein [Nesterenkonia pannonica]|uniref:RNase adapter RapZ n=1 Tax=Nesterenkonia pannonica TaxID=1548602 RepID=UPI002164172E|nr:RNase adapter RapZ [Nesterenkonia pannonica]